MSKELDRLKELSGLKAPEAAGTGDRNNMYQIRQTLTESSANDRARYDADEKAKGKDKVTLKKAPWEESVEEAAKPDYADIDGDGDKKETMKKAAKDKEKVDESEEDQLDEIHYGTEAEWREKAKKTAKDAREGMRKNWEKSPDNPKNKKPTTEQEQMREWANSIGQAVNDRGQVMDQPEGETVDLSLRRYLDADPSKVSIEESHTPETLAQAYQEYKRRK